MSDVDALRNVLRALAEVRGGPFYSLYVDLSYRYKDTVPTNIGFRIDRAADNLNARLVVAVSITRPDGIGICWSVSLQTSAESLHITASVASSDDHGWREVFERSANTTDSQQAANLIRMFANEVCAKR